LKIGRQVPHSKTNFGDRAFAVAGLASWNRPPDQQQSGHLTLCRISRTNWKLTTSSGPSRFLFHASWARASFMLQCQRN